MRGTSKTRSSCFSGKPSDKATKKRCAELIAKTLSDDWGFYYTVTTNLAKARELMATYQLSKEDRAIVDRRIDSLTQAIDREPKSLRWNLRTIVGTRQKWYEEVEEVERGPISKFDGR